MSSSPDTHPPTTEPDKESWETPVVNTLDIEETLGGMNVFIQESQSGAAS